jgi:hypothetical protein
MLIPVTVFSKVYMEVDDETWCARPSADLLRRIHSSGESSRWIATLDGEFNIAIGDHVQGDQTILFVPSWFLLMTSVSDGDVIEVDFKPSEEFVRATRLGFKVMGNIPDDMDIRSILEEPLSQLGVLNEGQIIPIPGTDSMLMLDICEPEGMPLFMDGAEVILEIEHEAPQTTFRSEESIPDCPFVETTPGMPGIYNPALEPKDISENFLPSFFVSNPKTSTQFIPFSGKGHRLGGGK